MINSFAIRAAFSTVHPKMKAAVAFWVGRGFVEGKNDPYTPIDKFGGVLKKKGDHVKETIQTLKAEGYKMGGSSFQNSGPVSVWPPKLEKQGKAAGYTVVTLNLDDLS
jgi:hypothetical protein